MRPSVAFSSRSKRADTLLKKLALGLALSVMASSPVLAKSQLVETVPAKAVKTRAALDWPEIRKRGELRILVDQNSFPAGNFNLALAPLEQALRAQSPKKPIRLSVTARPADQLADALARGQGDLLVSPTALTVPTTDLTPLTVPQTSSPLVVVSRQGSGRLRNPEQLSGRTLVLPAGSPADKAVADINQNLSQKQQAPVNLEWANPTLSSGDILEMVEAGLYTNTVVEKAVVEQMRPLFPDLQVDMPLALGKPVSMYWYVRKDAQQLRDTLNTLLTRSPSASLKQSNLQAYSETTQVGGLLQKGARQRLEKIRPLLQKHAKQNKLDWLSLAAIAYKESKLDPSVKSSGGAVGLMQITPNAARSVGLKTISEVDDNVQAAARYLAKLRQQYFPNPKIAEPDRNAFLAAAYNMGPKRLQGLRDEARKRGLDPNRWYSQVERVALDEVGPHAVNYVQSVNKLKIALERQLTLPTDKKASL